MQDSRIDNTEEVLKRLLVNIEAFKRLEKDNQQLQNYLINNETAKRAEYKRKVELATLEASKRELQTKQVAKEVIEKFRKSNDALAKELAFERRKSDFLARKYRELSSFAKRLDYDNRLMKGVLIKTNSQKIKNELKVAEITKKLAEKHELTKIAHMSLLKEYELFKLEKEKTLVIEKKRNAFITNKYAGLIDAFDRAKKDYNRTRRMNEALIQKVTLLVNKSLANEKVLAARTELIKIFFEKKLKAMMKGQIDQEIDYKARIESMSRDLVKYYDELKVSKQRYFQRENEIREKIKKLLD